ncbi:MAG: hypothetical protein ACE5GQ_02880 [Nitrospinales bacterium]
MSRSIHYLYIFLFLSTGGLAHLCIHSFKIRFATVLKTLIIIAALAIIVGIFNETFHEKLPLLQRVVLAKLLNNIMVQFVWGFGILLVLLLPVYYRSFSASHKTLLFNLLGLFLGFTLLFSVFSMHHPRIDKSILDRIKFLVEFPGRIAVRTSSREFFILFPSLIFLMGITFFPQNASSKTARFFRRILFRRSLFNGINLLILGNLIVIFIVFLSPRAAYLQTHWGQTHSELQRSVGSRDVPNLNQPTYIIAHSISRHTPEDSIILFPHPYGALEFAKKPYDALGVSAAYDILYPRVLFWEEVDVGEIKKKYPKKTIYLITSPNRLDNRCKNHPEGKSLDYHEWYLCPFRG